MTTEAPSGIERQSVSVMMASHRSHAGDETVFAVEDLIVPPAEKVTLRDREPLIDSRGVTFTIPGRRPVLVPLMK